jgi:hypothetical protein
MKLIKTSNPKEIEWLLKEKHAIKETDLDFKIFEVEEDVILPDFSVTPPENKIDKKNKETDGSSKKKGKNKSSKNKR